MGLAHSPYRAQQSELSANPAYPKVAHLAGVSLGQGAALDTHWLEGVAELFPTRIADSAALDPFHLTTKQAASTGRFGLIRDLRLQGWALRWSWEVLSGGLAWDKVYRGRLAKSHQGLALLAASPTDQIKAVEFAPLQRQR